MKKLLIVLSLVPKAAFGQFNIDLELLSGGYSQPVDIVNAGDERLFVVEKSGKIKILFTDGAQGPTPFLDITSRVTSGGEKGLLGLAFAPDYATSGAFYVNYTYRKEYEEVDSLFTRISRFTVDPDNENLALISSEDTLLEFYQPFDNHNGGQLEFGSDGYLYIATGDGGSGGDPNNNAQNKMSFLGKLLRIDVSTTPYSIPSDNPFGDDDSALDEIWAYGLRNPWKFAFDSATDDLFIGDVGQSQIEEVNFQPAGAAGGANYGWRCYEGTQTYNMSLCADSLEVIDPVFEYDHDDGCSITGGRVYRGAAFPYLEGKYILTDFCSGNYWLLWQENGSWQSFEGGFLDGQIVAFGEDNSGEIYAVKTSNGSIYKVVDATEENIIQGSVSWLSDCGNRSGSLELYYPGTTDLAHQYEVLIDSSGQFQIDLAPIGTFDIFLNVEGYLVKTIGIQTLTPSSQFDFSVIIAGDINNDNVINLSDFSLINLSFGKALNDLEYNALADLNCDAVVNIVDVSIFGSSFGLQGNLPSLE